MMIECRCGTLNPDTSKYCQECGNKLYSKKVPRRVLKEKRNLKVIKEKTPDNTIVNQDSGTELVKHEIEKPWGVALLNIALAGWGMLYIKQYSKAVLCVIIVISAAYIGLLLGIWLLTVTLAYLFIIAWTYEETKKHSQEDIK